MENTFLAQLLYRRNGTDIWKEAAASQSFVILAYLSRLDSKDILYWHLSLSRARSRSINLPRHVPPWLLGLGQIVRSGRPSDIRTSPFQTPSLIPGYTHAVLHIPSSVLYPSHDIAPNLRPVDLTIQLLIQKPTNSHVLPPYQIKPMRYLFALFCIIVGAYHPFNGILEDDIGQLIAGEEGPY